MSMVESRQPWPARVRVLATMGGAVLAFVSGLAGMAVTSTTFIGQRAVAQADIQRRLEDLRSAVQANHEETKSAIAGVRDDTQRTVGALQQSWHEARDKRDGELAKVGERMEKLQQDVSAVQQDVSRVSGEMQFLILNPPQKPTDPKR